MPSNKHVNEQIRVRTGSPIVLTIGADVASFRGVLIGVSPAGTDNSDGGLASAGLDEVVLLVRVNRQKS